MTPEIMSFLKYEYCDIITFGNILIVFDIRPPLCSASSAVTSMLPIATIRLEILAVRR